jgi:hypothetical protein
MCVCHLKLAWLFTVGVLCFRPNSHPLSLAPSCFLSLSVSLSQWLKTRSTTLTLTHSPPHHSSLSRYGTFSSNRIVLVESYFQPVMDSTDIALQGAVSTLQKYQFSNHCAAAAEAAGALHFPTHLAPWGFVATVDRPPEGDLRLRWNGIFAAHPFIEHWEYTGNVSFMQVRMGACVHSCFHHYHCLLIIIRSSRTYCAF